MNATDHRLETDRGGPQAREAEPEPTQAAAARAELHKLMGIAERISNGRAPVEADPIRVLAGLVRHLAEQTERLATLLDVTP